MTIPNKRITAAKFNDLQINAPTIVEDRGLVDGNRLMIVHLDPVVRQDGHADLDVDFSHELDSAPVFDWIFEACGRCMELAEGIVFDEIVMNFDRKNPFALSLVTIGYLEYETPDGIQLDIPPALIHEASTESGPLCDPKWERLDKRCFVDGPIVPDEDVTCEACKAARK